MKTLTDFRKTVEIAVWHESTPGTGQIVGTLLKWSCKSFSTVLNY